MKRLARAALIGLAALILAGWSVSIQRFGPDHGIYCALGKSSDGTEIWCPEPKLNGGWPAPFVFDNAGISIERSLSFEDDFRLAPFVASWAFYALIAQILWTTLAALAAWMRRRQD